MGQSGRAAAGPARARETVVSSNELHRTLRELRAELAEVSDVDPSTEKLLLEIRSDIDAVMEKAEHHALGERLGEALQQFEASHPRLAEAMSAVLDQLSRIGI